MDKMNLESFFCFNCGAKNYFDKEKYASDSEDHKEVKRDTPETELKEVSIECKSCREINAVQIEI